MKIDEKVSVIVVSYNQEETISKALDSILCQKTNFDFKVIVADDSSTDKTAGIISEYALRYPEIVVPILREKNLGSDFNMQGALEKAKGEYLAFCDGDDYWCDDSKLQIAVDVLDNNMDCILFVHNTLLHRKKENTKENIVSHSCADNLSNNRFTIGQSFYTHTSALVCRNIELPIERDTFKYCYLLSKGFGYYHDQIMSVYYYDNKGIWSNKTKKQQDLENFNFYYKINKFLEFKYDDFYTGSTAGKPVKYKKIFGRKLGWYIFLKIEALLCFFDSAMCWIQKTIRCYSDVINKTLKGL